jgi:hypothetical protein
MPSVMRSAPDGYELGKRLNTSARSDVCVARRSSDGAAVVLKCYRDERADSARSARREYEILRRLASVPHIPRTLDLDLTAQHPVLILEPLTGIPLPGLLDTAPLGVEALLTIALQLVQTLDQIHGARILHRNITPQNVLVERGSLKVTLIDFGSACEIGAAQASERRADEVEGTPHYVAPEQTGWLNRGCDVRSDLYSLGATLYHACTGRPPFPDLDPAELIHAHLARVPRSPVELRADLPRPLAALVLKLLRKEPEERYQSARSLHSDLVALREQLGRDGRIAADFELGSAEVPDRPRFSSKLYGRERELEVLKQAYERCAAGAVQLVLVGGEPGAGKSALVEALRPEIARRGGYVALAKFDPFRDRPYAGWAAALGALVQQLLAESTARLERGKAALLAGLGNVARALIELVPDLEFLLGDVPPVPPLGPAQTRARLALALQRFIASFATPEHPLVLFLDDLQWSDAGSRALLEELVSNEQGAALLLIGAYRAANVDREHPLSSLGERLEGRGVRIERLELAPLGAESAASMLADALERPIGEVRSFAGCVARKTGNSPFLIQQFVLHMHSLGLIRFAPRHGWTWNDAAIAAADIPEGAVALMVSKLERLDPAARELIEFASCVGDSFDVEQLLHLSGRDRDDIEPPLFVLAEEGLIAPAPGGFRFAHDRIREAAQSLLSDAARSRLHHDAGKLLLARTPEAERAQRAFEIVEHLNRGRAHLEADLRIPLMDLNLTAGKRALAAGAGATASGYLTVARELFGPSDWETRRELGFDLYLQSAESAFQNGDYSGALALLATLDQRAPSRLELAQVASKRLRVLALIQDPDACLRYVVGMLRRLGVRWPDRPSLLRVRLEILRVWLALRARNIEQTLKPATQTDPRWLAPLLVQMQAGATYLRVDVRHAALANCFVMRRLMRSGFVSPPGYTVAGHALYWMVLAGNAQRSQRIAQSGARLSERFPDPVFTPRTELLIHFALQPWLMRRRRAIAPAGRIAEAAREIGDREFEMYARFLEVAYLALAGDPLPSIEQRMRQVADSVQRSGVLYPEPEVAHRVYHLLLVPGTFELERRLAESDAWIAAHPSSAEVYLRTFWLLVLCVLGRHDLAFAQSEALGDKLFRVAPFVHVADHTFYRGLCAAVLATDAPRSRAARYRRVLRKSRTLLRRWAKNGPDFVHMATLLEAEHARLRGQHRVARAAYERAAQEARQQHFPHHAALAHERRALFLTSLRRETEASAALEEATALYREWGAIAKLAHLAVASTQAGA